MDGGVNNPDNHVFYTAIQIGTKTFSDPISLISLIVHPWISPRTLSWSSYPYRNLSANVYDNYEV